MDVTIVVHAPMQAGCHKSRAAHVGHGFIARVLIVPYIQCPVGSRCTLGDDFERPLQVFMYSPHDGGARMHGGTHIRCARTGAEGVP